jgi:uncharacterized membrane protein
MAQRLFRLIRNPTFQAVAISLAIALLIYGRHLFDAAVPDGGDVRSQILRIEVLHNSLTHGSWPGWIPWWYQGFPADQYYPTVFSFLGATLTFITTSVVVSYKLLLFFALISNGLGMYCFARRFLKFSSTASILSLMAYESSFFLLLNYAEGAGPNLLGWSIAILFLTLYLSNMTEGRVYSVKGIALPGLLFGISVLTHPFSAIFAVLAVSVFHILELAHSRTPRVPAKSQLLYFALVFGIGALLSITYWLPYLLTYSYASPLYVSTNQFVGKEGMRVLTFFTSFTLIAALVSRWRIRDNGKLDLMITYFVLCSALGFGLTLWIPLIGTFLHPFRFATIMAPFFGILLTAFLLDYLLKSGIGGYRRLLMNVGAVCLVVISVALPSVLSYSKVEKLSLYKQNYLQADYAETFESVQGGRLIIPLGKGYLCEGDSFGWRYSVETVTGGYNQGDPKFPRFTAHLEWDERWFNYEDTRENVMQESGAEYMFIRSPNDPYPNMQGMTRIVNNSYGQLWQLDRPVARAANVIPILLDVSHPQQVTDFFNILVPGGYRLVFVNASEVSEDMRTKFDYVMVDDEARIAQYGDETIFFLRNESASDNSVARDGKVISLSVPYLDYASTFFFQGHKGDAVGWMSFGYNPTPEELADLEKLSVDLEDMINGLEYQAVNYEYRENQIRVDGEPGFTLVKDSYFPYWGTDEGQILSTTQGFILTYSDDASVLLRYQKPAINTAATIISLLSFAGILVAAGLKREDEKREET